MGADRIQAFPPSAVSVVDEPGALSVDSTLGQLFVINKANQAVAARAAAQVLPAQTPLTTITTAQTMLTLNFAAGELNAVGRTISIFGSIVFTSPAATPTITIAVKLGATTLCTITSAAVAGSQTNAQLQFEFELTTASTGASGSIEAHGAIGVQLSATLSTALAWYADQNTAATGSLNLTTAEALTVTIAASSTITSATLRQSVIEMVA